MKHLLTAAFAALALGAAQAIIAQPDWTATDNWGSVGDLALSDGCGTLSALITIPASFSANKAAIFKIGDDMLAGGSADIGFRLAGAEVTTSVLCNLEGDDILRSIHQMKEHISRCHIFVLSGGFSAGDEPDGSGKFIDRGGLILGICNGFQALVKSGLLPYGRLGRVTESSPTLFRNDINRHVSQIVTTRVASLNSPWLAGFELGELHSIAVSHGEGKFVVSDELARELFDNGQVAFQYADPEGRATAEAPYNPNGSNFAIEGIISRDGQILGKMGHTERWEENLFKNIAGNREQAIFRNAVNYFRKR